MEHIDIGGIVIFAISTISFLVYAWMNRRRFK